MFRKGFAWAVFAAFAVVFLLVKIDSAAYSASDENTYYKMGQLISKGEVPYRDFFFAHPPLQVYIYAIVFKFFGFNLGILKFISAAAAAVAAFFIFKVLKEKSEAAAIIGSALFLFSHSVLLFTSFPTGTEFVMMFSIASFYFFSRKMSFTSGLLLGLGAVSGLLALIPAGAMGFWLLLRDISELRRFVFGFAAIVLPATAIFIAIAGKAYVAQTVLFNLLKPEGVVDKWEVILRVLKSNWLLFGSALAVVFAGGKLTSRVAVPFLISGLFALAFAIMEIVFDYYSLAIAPFVALIGAQGIIGAVEAFNFRRAAAYSAVGVLVAIVSLANYNGFSGNDFHDFPAAREVAVFVKENSSPNETIFGEDATTPLVSLLSGREIALNFVDSNDLRFRTGFESEEQVIARLKNSSLKFFLVRRLDFGDNVKLSYGIATLPKFDKFIKEECRIAREFLEKWRGYEKEYAVYDCS